MSKDFLSQDEVDALLRGVRGDAEEEVGGEETEDTSGVRPYNLATQERVVRGRMPNLEIIHERFARLLRIGLFNYMRRSADISVGSVQVLKYSEFVRNLVVPTNLNLISAKPLRGTGLIVFEPKLVFVIIDSMFGGVGRFHTRVEGREFTATEQRIIRGVLDAVFDSLEKSWSPVYPLRFEFLRSEMNTQFANIATPNEVVVTQSFALDFGEDNGGEIHVCLPYSMLEPIRDLLYGSLQGDTAEADSRWIGLLRSQIQLAEVELSAQLADRELTVAQLLHMKIGDVINIDVRDLVRAEIEGVPVLECRYGVHNGNYALRVERWLTPTAQEKTSC